MRSVTCRSQTLRPGVLAISENSPFDKHSKVGFIGAGRLGSSLAIAMQRIGYQVVAVSSRQADQRDWLSHQMSGVTVTEDAQEVANASGIVFITTSDGAIETVASSIRWNPGQAVIHCSGAVPLDALQPAESAGAVIGGLHPAQTFPSRDASDSFTGIPFGVEASDTDLQRWLNAVAKDLGGTPISITADQRSAYHASVVMACGLISGMTGLAAEVWASTGALSRDEAVTSLSPLVTSTVGWIKEKGIPAAMTGPHVRGDVETIKKHIEATSAISPEMGTAYAAVALASLGMAREQGGMSEDAYQNIKSSLKAALRSNCAIIE